MPISRLTKLYLALALTQAAHSIEEMGAHLYEFFDVMNARYSYPIRNMSADTFAQLNMLVIAVMLGLVPFVQARRGWALGAAGFVAAIEVLNGIGHPAVSFDLGRYMPGTYTAPVLFVLGLLVLGELWRSASNAPNSA